ncbi:MAG: hypothetical protein QOJ53_1089 [Sphingomonadales bacterium]|nr:hypothetical protein [Sphingomonadales bacterium]
MDAADLEVRGRKFRRVVRTLYVGDQFQCQFYGGPRYSVTVRNLQPSLDGIRVHGDSFGTNRYGGVVPNAGNPGSGGTDRGSHILPGFSVTFDFAASVPSSGPYFHRVTLLDRDRVGAVTNADSVMSVGIETNGDTTGCI